MILSETADYTPPTSIRTYSRSADTFNSILPRDAAQERGYAIVCLSVRLSVCNVQVP